jgi:hypothetical protein
MNQPEAAAAYADSEIKYLPAHFDEQAIELVRFMLIEAYNAGRLTGFNAGMIRAHEIASDNVSEKLAKLKERNKDTSVQNI